MKDICGFTKSVLTRNNHPGYMVVLKNQVSIGPYATKAIANACCDDLAQEAIGVIDMKTGEIVHEPFLDICKR